VSEPPKKPKSVAELIQHLRSIDPEIVEEILRELKEDDPDFDPKEYGIDLEDEG
jgi:hypothetical protein